MIIFDVTVLYHHRGRVTGIPRVVQKYAASFSRFSSVRFVYFDRPANGFVDLPEAEAHSLIHTEEGKGAPDRASHKKKKGPFRKIRRRFGQGEKVPENQLVDLRPGVPFLVFFVTSERHRNAIKSAADKGARIFAFIYDLIPIRVPQFCAPEVTALFPDSMDFLLSTAEELFCISKACEEDLKAYADERGRRMPRTDVIYLGDEPLEGAQDTENELGAPEGAFLCVATIEPRKNHEMLVNLWDRFAKEARVDIPPLVLVGQKGWLVDDFMTKLGNNPRLTGRVFVYHGVSDQVLVRLYQSCRMTLFPSHYETWSLPIRESLAAGKFVLAGDSPGLREAGEGLTEHIDPLDFRRWYNRVVYFAKDDQALTEREAAIRDSFKLRTWESSALRAKELVEGREEDCHGVVLVTGQSA